MYAIRSYYAQVADGRAHAGVVPRLDAGDARLHLVAVGVITSYSIHYTKLYDDHVAALGTRVIGGPGDEFHYCLDYFRNVNRHG